MFDGFSYGPHRGASVVAYDLSTETKIAQQNFVATAQSLETVAFEGVLFGTSSIASVSPLPQGERWLWRDGEPQFISRNWRSGGWPGFQIDFKRGWLYETTGNNLLVLDMKTMALVMSIPRPKGQLVGHDPGTDQLYFLHPVPTNSYSGPGQLWSWPAWTIRPPTSEPMVATAPPTLPVRALSLLPNKMVAGIWQAGTALEDYMVLERYGGCFTSNQMAGGVNLWPDYEVMVDACQRWPCRRISSGIKRSG